MCIIVYHRSCAIFAQQLLPMPSCIKQNLYRSQQKLKNELAMCVASCTYISEIFWNLIHNSINEEHRKGNWSKSIETWPKMIKKTINRPAIALTCHGGQQERSEDDDDKITRLPGPHGSRGAYSQLEERDRGEKLGEKQQKWLETERNQCLSLVWTQRNLQMWVVCKELNQKEACTSVDKIDCRFPGIWWVCESQWSPCCRSAVH